MALVTGLNWKLTTTARMQHVCMVQLDVTTLPRLVDLAVRGVAVEVACGRALEPSSAAQEPPAQCTIGSPCGGGCS
eukprot:2944832-Lingulodinium_polyedra.AAC.1